MTMSGIWTQSDDGWSLSSPEGFADEATLHDLIEKTPEMLPLSGTPALVILGREVLLGSGYADLLGVETSGRPVIVEVKLAYNNEARRAVVAQILAYAASLHGMSRQQLEDRVRNQLRQRDHATLVDAVRSTQEDAFDVDEFTAAVDEHLREGRFRLVFVLDDVPAELMTLVAYLEHVTDKLVIDLVAVNSFNVGGTFAVLPQRVTPERHEVTVEKTRSKDSGTLYRGSDRFETSIQQAPPQSHEALHRLLEWAHDLEKRGYVTLETYEGKGAKRFTLLPRLIVERRGLVTIWNDGGASIQFWRSVFERKAPDTIERIGQLAKTRVGQGNTIREYGEELLEALTEAYKQAATAQ
ncbi:MAG: hypothetical protein OXC98_05255 [bacterium]|nr:hypothetical protein [Acidimicrobiia bacterium]MCY4649757.1 hypothetical protein [bacterium]